jgi:hypothetical protein
MRVILRRVILRRVILLIMLGATLASRTGELHGVLLGT